MKPHAILFEADARCAGMPCHTMPVAAPRLRSAFFMPHARTPAATMMRRVVR